MNKSWDYMHFKKSIKLTDKEWKDDIECTNMLVWYCFGGKNFTKLN
jgi:hypothetical protein